MSLVGKRLVVDLGINGGMFWNGTYMTSQTMLMLYVAAINAVNTNRYNLPW